jgi:adenine-specific DNA-methyltransferase
MSKRISRSKPETKDYRHTDEKRKNIPPARIAAEGEVPKIKKVHYYYSPHLSPELRFDPTGKADRLMMVKEKASQYLTKDETELLDKALTNQQPWLEWAGKKEQYDRAWFGVDPVALHIHERISTQAIVRAAMREDLQRDLFADPQLPYQKEIQFYRHDIDWANRLILGDSLQVMSSLAKRENLAGKIQMIYIDPPYGIKFASNFQPEVGKREVKDKTEDLTRETEMVKAYRDTWNMGVHSYLAYLRDRLIVARELLTQSGSVFMQISDENLHRVRSVMDEVFGSENFCCGIKFFKTTSQTSRLLPQTMDHLLWYAKDRSSVKWRPQFAEKDRLGVGLVAYDWIEEISGCRKSLTVADRNRLAEIIKNGGSLCALDNLTSQSGGPSTQFTYAFQGQSFHPASGGWKTNIDGMRRLEAAERLGIKGNRIRFVRLIKDFPVTPVSDCWDDVAIGGFVSEDKRYVVQTSPKVIGRCVLMTTDPGDLVLDPTCGSGTTAYVAEQWGRRWITIDTSRVSIAIARQRLLTPKFEHYRLRDDAKGPGGGFFYKTIPHITLKSMAQNQNLDPIYEEHEPILARALEECNKALAQVSDTVRDKLRIKLMEKQRREGKRAVSDADNRRWNLPAKGEKWEHWDVPFDVDSDWPKSLQDATHAYRGAWRAKIGEVNACIQANAEQEELVDQPEVVPNIIRVSGPFTVEGVRPEELSSGEGGSIESGQDENIEIGALDVSDEVQNLRAYLSRMIDLIRKDGVTFPNNRLRKFARVDPLFEEKTGTPLHAEGIWESVDLREPNNIAIAFGPQYGPVTAQQVEDVIHASRRYDELVIAGFSFDGEAAVAIQEAAHPKLKIHMAHIRPDVSPGMDGLLKDTPNSQLFSVFGQPEIKVLRHGKDEVKVELLGVDIFDPLKGEVYSTGAEKVAAWFLDSDYDGRCFCIAQAFFPDQDAWRKIAKALGSQADEDSFAAFKGTVSLPFKPGKHNRIAVKVIDPRGNEVMTFKKLGE